MTFRQNVIMALIDLGLGQKEICEGSGITQATLSNALNKQDRKPNTLTEEKVKRYLAKKGYKWQ